MLLILVIKHGMLLHYSPVFHQATVHFFNAVDQAARSSTYRYTQHRNACKYSRIAHMNNTRNHTCRSMLLFSPGVLMETISPMTSTVVELPMSTRFLEAPSLPSVLDQ